MRSLAVAGLLLAAAIFAGLLTGCRHQVAPTRVLQLVPEARWPVLEDDHEGAGFTTASERSLEYLGRLPSGRVLDIGGVEVTVAELENGLQRLQELVATLDGPEELTAAVQQEFVLLQSVGRDGRGEVLFTGYYEPVLEARREPEAAFVHPLYEVPGDMVTVDLEAFGVEGDRTRLLGRVEQGRVVPYPDREAIDFEAAVAGRAAAVGYLDDLVLAFFLHVQGSGQLVFADGDRIRVGYSSGNGHPYRSIGRLLLDEGLMTVDEMSMQAIQRFLADNPDQLRRVLSHNPSYVFFRVLPAENGPLGCFELPLTAHRSIATDRRLFPAPVPAFVQGTLPTADGGQAPFSRLVLNQDTGGAIRGPGRVDLFFGTGDAAGELAGRTKHLGKLYILLPKSAVVEDGQG